MRFSKISGFALGPAANAVLGVVSLPLITWMYSSEDVGRLALLQVVSSFFVLFLSLGLDQSYVREYHASSNKPLLLRLVVFPGLLLLFLCFFASIFILRLISSSVFSIDSALIGFLIVLCGSALFFTRFSTLILRMQERGVVFSLFQILPRVFFILLVLSFYLVWDNQEFLALISAHVTSVVTVSILCFWVVRLEWRLALGQQFNIHESVPLLRFGMPLVAGGLAYWCMSTIDRVLLRSLSGFEELAVYSVATSFAMIAALFQSVFSVVWAPIVYKWVEQGVELDRLNVISETVLLVVLLFTCIAGSFSWVLLFVLPEEYARVRFLLPVCMLCPLFYALSEVSGIGLGISKRSGYAMLASFIGLLVALVFNFLLIPRLGSGGAGIASAIAFWIYLVIRTEFSCRVWRSTPRWKMYLSTFALLLAASYMAISLKLNALYFALAWVSIGVMFILVFWSRLVDVHGYWRS